MNSILGLLVMIVTAFVELQPLRAQTMAPSGINSLVRSSTPPPISNDSYTASTAVMVKNRGRTLGNQASGAGTRYFAVTDQDLAGKTPQQILDLLTPSPVRADDGVRRMEIFIEATRTRPLTLFGDPGKAVNVGTVLVDGLGLKSIDVNSTIVANSLTVIGR